MFACASNFTLRDLEVVNYAIGLSPKLNRRAASDPTMIFFGSYTIQQVPTTQKPFNLNPLKSLVRTANNKFAPIPQGLKNKRFSAPETDYSRPK